MPDSSGFGDYSESGVVVPCLLNDEKVNFTLMMYLNDEPPTTGGREIWGFPKKFGQPKLQVKKRHADWHTALRWRPRQHGNDDV